MVRLAHIADIPRLIELGEEFFNMTELREVTHYDPTSAGNTFKALIESSDAVILVIEKDGLIVGGAGAVLTPFYFNMSHKTGQEFFWFVSKEYRGTRESLELFKKLESWARENGAQSFSMVSLACNYQQVSDFYQRQGYREQETNFLKRL